MSDSEQWISPSDQARTQGIEPSAAKEKFIKVRVRKRSSFYTKGAVITFAIIFLGGLVTNYLIYGYLMKVQASTSWPTVEGTIIESRIVSEYEHNSDGGSRMYSAHIVYQYTVNGKVYNSSQIDFGGEFSSSDVEDIQPIVAEYPPGSKVTVYYNPEDPSEAVLKPGMTTGVYIIVALVVGFTLIDGILLVLSFRGWMARQQRVTPKAAEYYMDASKISKQVYSSEKELKIEDYYK